MQHRIKPFKTQSGFIFLTLMMSLVGIGLISAITFPVMLEYYALERRDSESEIKQIHKGLLEYFRDVGALPENQVTIPDHGTQNGIAALLMAPSAGGGVSSTLVTQRWKGPYISGSLLEVLNDAWGNPYFYTRDPRLGGVSRPYTHHSFLVASCGQDGVLSTISSNPPVVCGSVTTDWPNLDAVEQRDDLILLGGTEIVRNPFRREALARMGHSLGSDPTLRKPDIQNISTYMRNHGFDITDINEAYHPTLRKTLREIYDFLDPTIPQSEFYLRDPAGEDLQWQPDSTLSYAGTIYSYGVDRDDDEAVDHTEDVAVVNYSQGDDDPHRYIVGQPENGLLDVTIVINTSWPGNLENAGCPDIYQSRGYWKTHRYGGKEREYNYAEAGIDPDSITSEIIFGHVNSDTGALPAFSGKPWVTLCRKRGPGNIFVQRVYLTEGADCEDPTHYRGEWHPIDGFSDSGTMGNNWVDGPYHHPTPAYNPSLANRIKLCVETGTNPRILKDVILYSMWGSSIIPEEIPLPKPPTYLNIPEFIEDLAEFISNYLPPELEIRCPGMTKQSTFYPQPHLLAGFQEQAEVIDGLYSKFISSEGYSYIGNWSSVGDLRPFDFNAIVDILIDLVETVKALLQTLLAIAEWILDLFGISIPDFLTVTILNLVLDLLNMLKEFFANIYWCSDWGFPIFPPVNIPGFSYLGDSFAGIDLSDGIEIGFTCDETRDSGWDRVFGTSFGTNVENPRDLGSATIGLCARYYEPAAAWQTVDLDDVEHYGPTSDYQELAGVPKDAEWVRFIFDDQRLGGTPGGLRYNQFSLPMGQLKFVDFNGNVLASSYGNGSCDHYNIPFINLGCTDQHLEAQSRPIWVGDMSHYASDDERTIFALRLPPLDNTQGNSGYRIKSMDYIDY